MALPTTSGQVNWTQPVYQIIARALRQISAIADEETPTAAMAFNALDAMNSMVTNWEASGIHVWSQEEAILFLQPNQTRYALGSGSPDFACLYQDLTQVTLAATAAAGAGSVTLSSAAGLTSGAYIGIQLDSGTNYWTTISGAPVGNVVTLAAVMPSQATSGAIVFSYVSPLLRPLRVPAARRFQYSSKIQTPVIMLARLDYDYLPNLYNVGFVTQVFFDPQTGNGIYNSNNPIAYVNCWPTPSDNTNALRFVSQRPIQYFSTMANVPDFPAEWTSALTWNLALEVAPEYDVPAERLQIIQAQADKYFLRCSAWDKEPEPIKFGMAMQPGYRGRN